MLTKAVFAFLHHALFVSMVVALGIEIALCRPGLSSEHAHRIRRVDTFYGLAAMMLIIIGFVRVVYFEKGASYYFGNVFFLIKLALFVLVAIASIYPTRRFIAWRKDLAAGRAPASTTAQMRTTQRLLHVQLLGVVLITLCAALMARGIG